MRDKTMIGVSDSSVQLFFDLCLTLISLETAMYTAIT